MTLINHEVLGEGYYIISTDDKFILVDKKYKRIVKKLIKKGYNSLSKEQLDERLVNFIKRFVESLIDVEIKTETETIKNILRLWYKDGFCHYKIFENGIVDTATISTNIKVNTCNADISKYPHFLKVVNYGFGYDFEKIKLYDADLESLYKMYKGKL